MNNIYPDVLPTINYFFSLNPCTITSLAPAPPHKSPPVAYFFQAQTYLVNTLRHEGHQTALYRRQDTSHVPPLPVRNWGVLITIAFSVKFLQTSCLNDMRTFSFRHNSYNKCWWIVINTNRKIVYIFFCPHPPLVRWFIRTMSKPLWRSLKKYLLVTVSSPGRMWQVIITLKAGV